MRVHASRQTEVEADTESLETTSQSGELGRLLFAPPSEPPMAPRPVQDVEFPHLPASVPLTFTLTMTACLSERPSDRPTFAQICTIFGDLCSEVARGYYINSAGMLQARSRVALSCMHDCMHACIFQWPPTCLYCPVPLQPQVAPHPPRSDRACASTSNRLQQCRRCSTRCTQRFHKPHKGPHGNGLERTSAPATVVLQAIIELVLCKLCETC